VPRQVISRHLQSHATTRLITGSWARLAAFPVSERDGIQRSGTETLERSILDFDITPLVWKSHLSRHQGRTVVMAADDADQYSTLNSMVRMPSD
jgi:hypothetical protein